jgi:hypothetical protein
VPDRLLAELFDPEYQCLDDTQALLDSHESDTESCVIAMVRSYLGDGAGFPPGESVQVL